MDVDGLDPNSYTAQRLQHATPEHLYLTSRRCFIGPIPEGWLKSHRRDLLGRYLNIDYLSRAATFSSLNTTGDRRTFGLDGSRSCRSFRPKPSNIAVKGYDGTTEGPPPEHVPVFTAPRTCNADGKIVDEELAGRKRTPPRSDTAKSRAGKQTSTSNRDNTDSFVTASEEPRPHSNLGLGVASLANSSLQVPSPRGDGSTSSLLPHTDHVIPTSKSARPAEAVDTVRRKGRGAVQFDVPDGKLRAEIQTKARLARANSRRRSSLSRKGNRDGEIIKMDKMLVRVDTTSSEISDDFDENEAHRVESNTSKKWRQYMVVCRDNPANDDDAPFTLKMYKTRVISDVEGPKNQRKAKYEIQLNHKHTKVNLFSSLDKTVVLWAPCRKGTQLFIMRPRSGSSAAEWYTFLRNILGWNRASDLQVNVPDLDIRLSLENPFLELETSREMHEAAKGNPEAMVKAVQHEQAIAKTIINRAIEMLGHTEGYAAILKKWTESGRMGLAWKRYDRLEWIHGPNEKKMYASIAMSRTHDLELRPKEHYPTNVKTQDDNVIEEPVPVEGFLTRLTSQRGLDKRLGRMFFKRLYFSTHDNYLVFSQPARAMPPPPPSLPVTQGSHQPSVREITEATPLVYAVNPYPVKDGQIEWLTEDSKVLPDDMNRRDRDAEDEAERKTSLLLKCDGYVDLCNVERVRKVHRGASTVDENIGHGSNVDFDLEVEDTVEEDGVTREFDDKRTFELVLTNGLVIRLQAFDQTTMTEWIHRLRRLVKYWKCRTATDTQLYKRVRTCNLKLLDIDENAEAYVGQFARKWEVRHAQASPELYHLCGISACRSIHMSGVLFRKPRRHATFTRCSVILSAGTLLMFQDSMRKMTGKRLSQIHHQRISTLDLRDCYLYSGLLTENDLLYRNRTFDSNKPGHTALPRIYPEDGSTSSDEDYMTCFALWHGRRTSLFRRGGQADKALLAKEEGRRGRFKLVSRLGAPGNTMVFKARSRAERDHWVLAIQAECERLALAEEVRIVKGA